MPLTNLILQSWRSNDVSAIVVQLIMIHAGLRWWWRVVSTSSAKSSSKPPKVPIGDVTSSIKRRETRGGRGSIWPQRTFLGARKIPLHLCTGVLVLTHLCTCACSCVPVHSTCAQNAARKWCAQHHWLIDSCRCWSCICIFGLAEGQSCQISAFNHQEIFTSIVVILILQPTSSAYSFSSPSLS